MELAAQCPPLLCCVDSLVGAKKKLVCQINVCLENWGLYMIPFDYEPTEAASFNKGQQKN